MGNLEEKLNDRERIKAYKKKIMHKYDLDFYKKSAEFVGKKRFWLGNRNVPELFFDRLIVKGDGNIKEVENKQLLYVSNHTSMADFLVQGYVFWKYNLPIPRFIAGENLNKGILGKLFRKWGAIYVNRNMSRGNTVYWKVYDWCVKDSLAKGECLLNYGEGARTNGDFVERFKTGTFKQVLDYIEEGNNMFIMPAYINYDKRIDSKFIDEARRYKVKRNIALENKQLKKAKIFDWIYYGLDFLSFVFRIFSRTKGNAYLYFGEAFSIKQFLENTEKRKKVALARKSRDEVVILENLYKHRKF